MEQNKISEIKRDNIDYLKMALALSGISIDRFTAELVIETWESIVKKQGKFSIKDSTLIEWRLRNKYKRIVAKPVDKTTKK